MFQVHIWAINWYSTICFIINNRDITFWKELSKLNSLYNELYSKKAEKCQKTRFFRKNVCLDARFEQYSGIQQFFLSQ